MLSFSDYLIIGDLSSSYVRRLHVGDHCGADFIAQCDRFRSGAVSGTGKSQNCTSEGKSSPRITQHHTTDMSNANASTRRRRYTNVLPWFSRCTSTFAGTRTTIRMNQYGHLRLLKSQRLCNLRAFLSPYPNARMIDEHWAWNVRADWVFYCKTVAWMMQR